MACIWKLSATVNHWGFEVGALYSCHIVCQYLGSQSWHIVRSQPAHLTSTNDKVALRDCTMCSVGQCTLTLCSRCRVLMLHQRPLLLRKQRVCSLSAIGYVQPIQLWLRGVQSYHRSYSAESVVYDICYTCQAGTCARQWVHITCLQPLRQICFTRYSG